MSKNNFNDYLVYVFRAYVFDSLPAETTRSDPIISNISQFFSAIIGKEVHLQGISVEVVKIATIQ